MRDEKVWCAKINVKDNNGTCNFSMQLVLLLLLVAVVAMVPMKGLYQGM